MAGGLTLVNGLDWMYAVPTGILAGILVVFGLLVWELRRTPATQEEHRPANTQTTPAPRPEPEPSTPEKPLSVAWVEQPQGSELHIEIKNETLEPLNQCSVRVTDLRPWAKGAFIKEDNNPRIAHVLPKATVNTLEPMTVRLVVDCGEKFAIPDAAKPLTGSLGTTWKVTLEASTQKVSYQACELFFEWGPRLSIASDPRET